MTSENYGDGIKRQFQAHMDLQNEPGSIGFGLATGGGGICMVQDQDVLVIPTLDGLRIFIETLSQIAEAWERRGSPERPDGWEDES